MILCLADVRVPCTIEELQRPSPQKILQVYEAVLEVTTGSATENCVLEDFQEMNDELNITSPPVCVHALVLLILVFALIVF